ncbi:SDR family oxidoreductase [Aureibacter tunicatorum]|uniref:NAD(P)-dependent dehydrogenase (Short-subunit alcohol dehydrogenase family) n=1 Tax=Aureibacter tunicatorum TaxID=866807 RepID=A0AAE3XN80_9BACT|nr:SDR family oxidoreductase [Aureibacter tunicatorum]MDR6238159.1 NAD(P)-dependent dehydrogenase (short-subunit alcohol dehydrogenase family) [Aureibacter tunicatorum]BDD03192.1 short-chain dehydrogenase [Aureibacter tunicatorum]
MKVTKHYALITGASMGLGKAAAESVAHRGYEVIGIARNMPEWEFPGSFYTCDLSNREESLSVFKTIKENYPVDCVFNNVGIVNPASVEELKWEDFMKTIELTVRTAVDAVQTFLPVMKEQHWGRIVNMSSIAANGIANRSSYSSSKAVMISLAKTWALELSKYNITVNAVAPGVIETPFFRKHNPEGSESEERYLKMIPGRKLGSPIHIGEAVAYLMSESAEYITGQTLFIDGGATIGGGTF